MQKIENDTDLIGAELSDVLTGGSFDRFCYAGIYSMEFTLAQPKYGFANCTLDIATKISITLVTEQSAKSIFSTEDFHKIWGKTIDQVKLVDNLSLRLFFGDWICSIPSYMEDPEKLFDLRWALFPSNEKESFSIWVSDEENVYMRK